jgi:hypothetical protein
MCVEVGMFLPKCRFQRRIVVLFVLVACVAFGQAPDDATESARDTLVFKDGDRLHGEELARVGDLIVFKSDRFGELRVPSSQAVVIKAEKSAGQVKHVVAEGIKQASPAVVKQEEEKVSIWERFSPAVLTAKVREFFGPWHGKVAFSDDVVTDTSHRNDIALEGRLTRKFKKDVVEMSARYEFDRTNDVTTTDVLKATGSWRHDFNAKYFSQYRPQIEWNRANLLKTGAYNNYVLMQHEFGFGVNLWATPARKVRLGISENLFDIWNEGPPSSHNSRAVESLFDETELALPWRMTLTQRGVVYPVVHSRNGWENQIELNKKLTETLSVALRHEIRRNNPDGQSQDYTRLKFLLGLDF